MTKRQIAICLVTVLYLCFPARAGAQSTVSLPADRIAVGIYDPVGIIDDMSLDMCHEFFSWSKTDDIKSFVGWCLKHQRFPMISVAGDTTASGDPNTVLSDTISGANDGTLTDLATAFKQIAPQSIIVRWGYEMELKGLNPWSQGNPAEFISAWKHIVDFMRKHEVTNVTWIWSPAGDSTAVQYYPGSTYVDTIGFTLLESDVWDAQAGLAPRSFKQLFEQKNNLFRQYRKPIMITEMGVTRPTPEAQKAWLDDALKYIQTTKPKCLIGVVYFNTQNPANIFAGDTPPDWTLAPEMLWKPEDMPAINRCN